MKTQYSLYVEVKTSHSWSRFRCDSRTRRSGPLKHVWVRKSMGQRCMWRLPPKTLTSLETRSAPVHSYHVLFSGLNSPSV